MIHWMKHPDNGVMPAYDTGERDRLKNLGWKEFDYEKEHAELIQAKVDAAAKVEADQKERADAMATAVEKKAAKKAKAE